MGGFGSCLALSAANVATAQSMKIGQKKRKPPITCRLSAWDNIAVSLYSGRGTPHSQTSNAILGFAGHFIRKSPFFL
jgi:hypothetical protein